LTRGDRRRRLERRRTAARAGGWPGSYVGNSTPDEVLQKVQWPPEWPYDARDMSRQDESDDSGFYNQPRLCQHVDDGCIAALKQFYGEVFPTYPGARILDICSSWISHYPDEKTWSHASITGMNEYELQNNKQADDYQVQNLNLVPKLNYDDESFDIVTCTVSFDYLNKPLEVMREVGRVLKPGGIMIMSTSNRCFPTKAVNVWVQSGDAEHMLIYGSYIHYSGLFEAPECKNLSSALSRVGLADPMYAITARKQSSFVRSRADAYK
ncbi:unnamed protein product, partial [Polarella glacialis]